MLKRLGRMMRLLQEVSYVNHKLYDIYNNKLAEIMLMKIDDVTKDDLILDLSFELEDLLYNRR